MSIQEHKLFFLIGASGSGKTTVAKLLRDSGRDELAIFFFDSIGVPSTEEMTLSFGSPDEWQRAKTVEWVTKIKTEDLSINDALLDAQTRPSFIREACQKAGVSSYKIILFDCDDSERKRRLEKRGQGELGDATMMNWAKYLRNECNGSDCEIIDTTHLSPEKSLELLISKMYES